MKKFLITLLCTICVCMAFASGFKQTNTNYAFADNQQVIVPKIQVVQQATGEVEAIFYIPKISSTTIFDLYNTQGMTQQQKNEFNLHITYCLNEINSYLINLIITAKNNMFANIQNDGSLSDIQKEEYCGSVKTEQLPEDNNYFGYDITFESLTVYKYFTTYCLGPTEETQTLLTTTKKIDVVPVLNRKQNNKTLKQSISQTINDCLKMWIFDVYGYNQNVKNLFSDNYQYTITLPSERFKSNAQSVFYDQGYYSHQWTLSLGDGIETNQSGVSVWYVQANKAVWYSLILALTIVFVLACYAYAKYKGQK